MGGPEIFVDPAGLRDVGRAVTTSLLPVDSALAQDGSRLTVTGTASQWGVAPVLAETAAAWQAYLKDLNQRLGTFGAGLVTAADRFEATDGYSAAQLAGIPKDHPAYGRALGYGQ